jgi:hypothetical protein
MYKVKTRYTTYYNGNDPEEAYQIYATLKQGGVAGVKMTPDLTTRGFRGDFKVDGNTMVFSNDYAVELVHSFLVQKSAPVEKNGKKIVIKNEKFAPKIVYLTQNFLANASKVSDIARNKLGITNELKKWLISLEGGNKMEIFAFSQENARAEAKAKTDNKILNIKELSNG